MSDAYRPRELLEHFVNGCSPCLLFNISHLGFNISGVGSGLELLDDGIPWMKTVISAVYFVVAAVGVLGNVLVMFLLYSTRTITKGTINFFVFNLALAQLVFSMVLMFWAVDIALDYSWPFGLGTCKAVCLLTGLTVYASCFFLTAMSLTRYCYVATALKSSASLCSRSYTSRVVTAIIWAAAFIAAAPRGVFADLAHLGSGNDIACLFRFPDGTAWLGINQLLRVVLGFLLPYTIITASYLLLLRFVCRHKLRGQSSHRKTDISKSVAVVVFSFYICWFPYNVISLWSALIQLDIFEFTPSFFLAQTYFFPVANCLAFTSSCFNPVIYCLVRQEYRVALHNVFHKLSQAIMSKMPCGINSEDMPGEASQLAIPLNSMCSRTSKSVSRLSTLPTVTSTMQ